MHFSLLQLQEPDTEMCQKVETFTLLMSSQPFFLWNNIKWLLKADVGPLVLQQQPDKKGESNLVTDVNTVEQLLWNPPHNPGCLFQLSPCSPMHIFVTTRDTEQGSYSNFFFFLMSWVPPYVSMNLMLKIPLHLTETTQKYSSA